MRFESDNIQLEGLDKLTKALSIKNPPHIEIGIIESSSRGSTYLAGIKQAKRFTTKIKRIVGLSRLPTNADIGAVHEYGAPEKNIPSRSWLRMPLTDYLQQEMETLGLLKQETSEEVMKAGSIMPWINQVKIAALSTVKKAFASNGFGKWKSWKPGYKNQTGQILVDSRQLRDSVDAKVVS